ncbi:MAG: hypothetical protein QOJ14_284, partial [Thermoleophilaceae bacterium]|nr:hypothetical protein [Thermoleophilaceae bacterium]
MLRIEAAAGENNHVVVERAGSGVDVTDSAGLSFFGGGCSPASSDPDHPSAHCDGPVDNVNASLSDGDDYFRVAGSGLSSWADGSSGDDTLLGGAGDDILLGAEGEDSLNGGAGSDWLYGGLDADSITGGPNVDYLYGQEGPDTLNSEDPVPSGVPWYFQQGPAPDDVVCGAGTDVATSDDYDGELWCERMQYPGGRVVTPTYMAGPNGPWEDAAAVVPSDDQSSIYPFLTLTSEGDAIAAWTEYHQDGDSHSHWAVKRHGEPLTDPAPATCCVVGLESDQTGNALMLSRTSSGDLQSSTRPPGGDFGAPVTIASGVASAGGFAGGALISNPQGDIAAVYGGLAAIRPRGSSAFQPPVATGAVGSTLAVALAGNGDLITISDGPASSDPDATNTRLFASIREADGTALPPQAISSGKRAFEAPQLVADATGDAA